MLTKEYNEYLFKLTNQWLDGTTYEMHLESIWFRRLYGLAKTPKGKKVYYRRYKGRK